ncbi:MAG: hypothetical protein IJT59_00675 [Desulfovibrionaceae bacterium]|nr:hypothetical protein [Desulfovibrionaceae bacterium]
MNILEFENWAWQHEKVKVFVRAPLSTQVKVDSPDAAMFSSGNTVRQFKQMRLSVILENLEYVIFDASMNEASGDMKLLDLRKGYREKNII